MSLSTILNFVLAIVIVLFVVSSIWFIRFGASVREEVERALDAAKDDEQEQAEIRKKVVKAMFPPRFPRD